LLGLVLAFSFTSINAEAQVKNSIKEQEINALIQKAELHYQQGVIALSENNFTRMRSEFDSAVDDLLIAGIDLHSDLRLQKYYKDLVDRIVQQQLAVRAMNSSALSDQRYEGTPTNDIGRITEQELQALAVTSPQQPQVKTTDFNFKANFPASVNQFISYFTVGKGRKTLEIGLARSGRYRQYAEKVFEREGVPTDLIWLAQVESCWQPVVTSPASARGLWQFIPSTGSRFGLNQNAWLDERLDPEKSTEAAARYLHFLADRYAGDWLLALAAYNMGENGLDKAINRCGYADYWELREQGYIPQETRNYVPAILAVIAIAKQPEAYGIDVKSEGYWQFDRIAVAGGNSLSTIANTLNISSDSLLKLNPQLVSYEIPPAGYSLRIPKGVEPKRLALLTGTESEGYKVQNVVKKRTRAK
jgi:membrane-bound lytic murein transglycosylase D